MRNSLLLTLAVTASFGMARAGDNGAKEVKRLAGTWLGTAAEESGEKVQRAGDLKVVFSNMELTFTDGKKTVMKGTFTVDTTGKPKAIDLKIASGQFEGQTVKGVYDLDGDVLKICFALPGLGRPKAVATTPGDGAVFLACQRQKP